ncbi:MAG: hypothetical protein RLY86_2013 [Pseudomonadota bacterium]|jgi:putative ABC transport system permease protein
MFQNYLTVALRNLVKHRLYSAINIVGLAVGLAASILILIHVRHETGYDRFFTQSDRIWQVTVEGRIPGRPVEWLSNSAVAMGPSLKQNFPEVEAFTRLIRQGGVLSRGDAQFTELLRLTDPDFFRIFDLPLVEGSVETALADPSGIVLTETMARKYFGDAPALGQTITLDNTHSLRVSGVLRDLPSNTHLEITALMPVTSVAARNLRQAEQNWGALCCKTYLLLKEGADGQAMAASMPQWMADNAPTLNGPTGPLRISDLMTPSIRPLSVIHTQPILADERPGTSLTEIWTFSAIAVLVLVIASINFMNLATARATQRAREVSVRKVVGAGRGQIITQFIGESVLLTLLGLVLAVALAELTLPVFSDLMGTPLAIDYTDPVLIGMLLGLAILVGTAGGAYPAFFLSGFNPAHVLKGASSGVGGGSGRLRAALVVVQFAISIGLMVATTVVYSQLLFARDKELGFDKENVVSIGFPRSAAEQAPVFLETLRNDPAVAAAALTSFMPGEGNESNNSVRLVGDPENREIVIRNDAVGYGFFQAMGMRLVAGRDFDEARGTDAVRRPDWQVRDEDPPAGTEPFTVTAGVVINEAALDRFGFRSAEEAVGRQLRAADSEVSTIEMTIIGVVQDFHFRSLHEPIAPAYFILDPDGVGIVVVRLRGGSITAGLDLIDRTWRDLVPGRPIVRQFLSDELQQLYQREENMSRMFAAFSGLAILIACLGLFGLASFTAERRTKEIGLRKVLGARVPDIVRLLVWQFSKPVLVANIIAWPLAWWGMSRWLEGFTYRIDLTPLPFLLAGAGALAIAWVTVGVHAAKVAQAKPIRALRYE